MKKEIKKQGTQTIISFTTQELKVQGWKVGDILDLVDTYVVGPQNYPTADHNEVNNG